MNDVSREQRTDAVSRALAVDHEGLTALRDAVAAAPEPVEETPAVAAAVALRLAVPDGVGVLSLLPTTAAASQGLVTAGDVLVDTVCVCV